jgi:uncharacterized protein
MIRYQLGKLVQWAGKLNTRKKMQKVAYLLKVAGCPIEAEFRLHHFGPYSSDVAQTTDVLVRLEMLKEERSGNMAGRQFNYELSAEAEKSLIAYESSPEGRKELESMEPFRKLANSLLKEEVRLLEIASTLVYFRTEDTDWPSAVQKTCEFKSLNTSNFSKSALDLAKQILHE